MGLTTVFGGSGFLGRRIVRRLVGTGETVRVAVRHPERAASDAVTASSGRLVPFAADIRDRDTVVAAAAGADAVVNAVSAYVERAGVTYAAVHVQGALNVAQACERQGVGRLVHISGIGADPASRSAYIRARGEGEQQVRQAFTRGTVLRPSVMFAPDDGFLNALSALVRASPVVPLIGGGRTRLQPVHADDVAEAASVALRNPAARGATYEIGGPATFTLAAMIEMIRDSMRMRRVLVPIPFWIADPLAHLLEALPRAPLTVAQVDLLKEDNVAAPDSIGLASLGLVPQKIEDVIATLATRYS